MAPKAPAPKAVKPKALTPAQTIRQGEQAGLIPTARPRKAKAKVRTERGRKPRKPKTNTTSGMVNKVRKLEQNSAMY